MGDVEDNVAATASSCDITVDGFHDAGWASVVGVGRFTTGQPVILKAIPDSDRYQQERAALTHWGGHSASRLISSDDTTQILLIELVGSAAGGSPRPDDHIERIADALPQLHEVEVKSCTPVPTLRGYYVRTVLPRIERRASRFGEAVGERNVRLALDLGADLCATSNQRAMLHADLYAENILFDSNLTPVFIDPHPKVGSPAFDWAFWCVYYRQDGEFATRIRLCRSRVPGLHDEVLAWSLTLAVDGALYYKANDETNVAAMQLVISSPELASLPT
ncbi:aminoglycoside phosphotransferase family protein [Amycolatopsis palatopharyngis]|uniref:aminoglycoside phosphotransferase family protein n=1 Tax=Amycolatopsis palatopharyngis TaxID=187982 RepID=UPI0013BE8E3E|nr:aminoglycoside phosphotransferase family protein [Amycolatopsis palatopharyngis]